MTNVTQIHAANWARNRCTMPVSSRGEISPSASGGMEKDGTGVCEGEAALQRGSTTTRSHRPVPLDTSPRGVAGRLEGKTLT